MTDPTRFDTLVVRNSTSKEVPREAAGGEICSWAAGHGLAELSVYEQFVEAVLSHEFSSIDEIQEEAQRIQERARQFRELGYDAEGED